MENSKAVENKSDQKIQLVKGEFTPSQASEVINALIDQKINYHKIENIQMWEKDHSTDQEPLKKRIKELENEKEVARKFIADLKAKGKKLTMDGTIILKAID
ncbi:hypothetical protein [Nonlabens antarcticus]|uniref:hypothetical protein n=1 Tax=Nonlabens antarcticus TaxID=392714 RepID=UPI00189149D5|nr:hypothetical protein [Nonlabens antarcticus]